MQHKQTPLKKIPGDLMPIDISSNLRAKTGDVHEMEDILDHEWAGTTRRNLKYLVK